MKKLLLLLWLAFLCPFLYAQSSIQFINDAKTVTVSDDEGNPKTLDKLTVIIQQPPSEELRSHVLDLRTAKTFTSITTGNLIFSLRQNGMKVQFKFMNEPQPINAKLIQIAENTQYHLMVSRNLAGTLIVKMISKQSSETQNNVGFFQGSPTAKNVRLFNVNGTEDLFDLMSYKDFKGFVEGLSAPTTLTLTIPNGIPISDFKGVFWPGETFVLFLTGDVLRNGCIYDAGKSGLSIWVATGSDATYPLERPLDDNPNLSYVQFVNATIGAKLGVDISASGASPLFVKNLASQTATPFLKIPAGAKSLTVNGQITDLTFEAGSSYVVGLSGIVNPDDLIQLGSDGPFPVPGGLNSASVSVTSQQLTTPISQIAEGEVELVFFHGSPDAPVVDFYNTDDGTGYADDLAYGQIGNNTPVVSTNELPVTLVPGNDNNASISYKVSLFPSDNKTAVIFVTGFANPTGSPINFIQDRPLQSWVAYTSGGTAPLSPESGGRIYQPLVDDNTIYPATKLYPNPARDVLNLEYTTPETVHSLIRIYDRTGKVVRETDLGQSAKGWNKEIINTNGLIHGQYFIQLIRGQEMEVRSFIINGF